MSQSVISVENLSKSYQLGVISTGTFRGDLQRWWAKTRGKPDPTLRIDQTYVAVRNGETMWALKDVSFDIQPGEAVGIIGRNGAGKSTLLKILSEVTAPTSGEVKIRGRIASLLEVGTGFHPELTGRENIYLNGAILGMKKAEITRKFDEIVDFSGVEQFIDTPVKRYSSGMYVRLAFAVAAHLEPEILVVDEVLAVGDAEFQKKCLKKMGNAVMDGRTVLFVSHGMDAIANLCNRAILIVKGKIKEDGSAKRVIQSYLQYDGIQSTAYSYGENSNVPIQIVAASIESDVGDNANNFFACSYRVRGQSENIMLCVEVHNSLGQCVYYANDDNLISERKRTVGLHNIQLSIPTNMLPSGEYYIVYGLWEPGHEPVDFPNDKIWLNIYHDESTRLSRHNIKWPSVIYDPNPKWKFTEES